MCRNAVPEECFLSNFELKKKNNARNVENLWIKCWFVIKVICRDP